MRKSEFLSRLGLSREENAQLAEEAGVKWDSEFVPPPSLKFSPGTGCCKAAAVAPSGHRVVLAQALPSIDCEAILKLMVEAYNREMEVGKDGREGEIQGSMAAWTYDGRFPSWGGPARISEMRSSGMTKFCAVGPVRLSRSDAEVDLRRLEE